MRLLLTGGTGNVGTALLRRLADERDVEVVALARRLPGATVPPYDVPVRWLGADVGADDLGPALDGVDTVVHTAWQLQPTRRAGDMHRTNVHGTARVLRAARQAGVTSFVHLSSAAAYAPGPKDRAVDEQWPTTGTPTSVYSSQKAAVERLLDAAEQEDPALRVVRVRPAGVLSPDASAAQVRAWGGPLLPAALLRPGVLPLVPIPAAVRSQVVASTDLADLLLRAVRSDLRGGLNVAADPVIGPSELAAALGARRLPVPLTATRTMLALTWRLHLQPTAPGWLDMLAGVPVLSTDRARTELGWRPAHDARDVLRTALAAAAHGRGGDSPVLRPLASLPRRLADVATGGRRPSG